MGSMSIMHWAIVLVVVILIFGTKKIAHMGKDLGEALGGFKTAIKDATESEHEVTKIKDDLH
jgi:sec-independent protein translocase protein TatA